MLGWHLKHGSNIEWYEEIEGQDNDAHIPALDKKPLLYPDLFLDWKAFQELSPSRHTGFGVGHIPISEIYYYMLIHEILDYDTRRTFISRIQILDNVFVDFHNSKTKKTRAPIKKSSKKKSRALSTDELKQLSGKQDHA